MTVSEMRQEALGRAVGSSTMSNYPAIFEGFIARGIDAADIKPRENVFTYRAWQALGRQVRKGEHGVRVCTVVETSGKTEYNPEFDAERKTPGRRLLRSTTVFHISQTDPMNGGTVHETAAMDHNLG